MTMSTILRVFLDSMDEPPGPREETYLIGAWARMSDADKRLAEDAVIERIRQTGAPRAIMSAVEMNLPRAIVDIAKWQQSADPQIKNTAERALRFLTPDVADLQSALTDGTTEERIRAAAALGTVPSDEAAAALLQALHDPDIFVRDEACAVLVSRHGLTPLVQDDEDEPIYEAPLSLAVLLITASLRALQRRAASMLVGAIDQLAAGTSLEQLGLTYVASDDPTLSDRFAASVRDRDAELELALIEAMGPHDRDWAEAFLAVRLSDRYQDPRAAAALATLGVAWTLEALEEALSEAPEGPFQTATEAAIEALRK